MNDLEKELDKFQGTNISSINKEDKYDRDIFKDNLSDCKDCKDNKDISSFVKEIEKNLDNFDNLNLEGPPMPSNVNIEFKNQRKDKIIESQVKELKKEPKNKVNSKKNKKLEIRDILIELKEPIIIIFLFILLNNEELNIYINNIPYFNRIPGLYPSLILRGAIMASIIYYLRKY